MVNFFWLISFFIIFEKIVCGKLFKSNINLLYEASIWRNWDWVPNYFNYCELCFVYPISFKMADPIVFVWPRMDPGKGLWEQMLPPLKFYLKIVLIFEQHKSMDCYFYFIFCRFNTWKVIMKNLETPHLYINLASVCLYPINVKTAESIGPKFFVGHHVTAGMNDKNFKENAL